MDTDTLTPQIEREREKEGERDLYRMKDIQGTNEDKGAVERLRETERERENKDKRKRQNETEVER